MHDDTPDPNRPLPMSSSSLAWPFATECARLPAGVGLAIVLMLTFAAYAPALRFQFVYDDWGQILQNPAVHSWRSVPHYFTSHVWEGFDPVGRGNYFRPLFLLWLRINVALLGTKAWVWHLITILTHVLTTYLVYVLVRRVRMSREVAVVAALIFGLHPTHIEAVAWISGVTEPLLGILLLVSLITYISARHGGRSALLWGTVSVFSFALALLEKETAAVFPFFLLLYEWFYEQKPRCSVKEILEWCRSAFRRIWGFIFILLLYVPLRIHALKQFSYVITPLSTRELFLTWPSLVWFWIRHLVWPVTLCTFYDLVAVTHATFKAAGLPLILDLLAVLILAVLARRSRGAMFFASWLVLPLIPLLDVRVFAANDFAHDRYLYLPSIGLAVLIAMALAKMCVGSRAFGVPISLLASAACLAAVLFGATFTKSFYFRDNLTFFAYNLQQTPGNPQLEANYGAELGETGNYQKALEVLLDVVNRYPNLWNGPYNLAHTYYRTGQLPEAEKYFLQAIRLAPHKPDQYLYLGVTRFKMGRTAEAIPAVRQAIAILPTGYGYHFALGMMLKTAGDLTGALREMQIEHANYPAESTAAAQILDLERQLQTAPNGGTSNP